VLHRIRDVDLFTWNPSGFERPVEEAARRSDKRVAFQVFTVARLLADYYECRVLGALAEYRLRAKPPQRTRAARRGGSAQFRD
jgi:hypothetical protein